LITFQAAHGETNDVEVAQNVYSPIDYTYTNVAVYDHGAPLTAGAGCSQVAADEALCGASDGPNVVADLGDGNDRFRAPGVWSAPVSGIAFTVHGGPGDDAIYGSQYNDLLYGDEGNDTVDGRPGDDVIYGGAGNDNLQGGDGNDAIDGDPGPM
jgi:hypothetical protein